MFNVECCKVHDSLKFFRRMLLNGGPCGFEFFWGGLPEKRAQFFLEGYDLHRNYDMEVILFYFICNYDNLALKLHQEKRSYADEGWILLVDLKLEVYQEWVLLVNHLKKVSKPITHSWSPRKLVNVTLQLFILKKDIR